MRKWSIVFVASLLVFLSLACQLTVSGPSYTEDQQLTMMLSGRHAVVFGDQEFVNDSVTELESHGMVVSTASDLKSAISLAGDGFVELHCLQANNETSVVQASSPQKIFWDGVDNSLVECVGGVMFLGFSTEDHPNILIP